MPVPRRVPALMLCLLLATPASAQDYARDPDQCRDGALAAGAVDGVRLGAGRIMIDGMTCTRLSDKRPQDGGWYRAAWDCQAGDMAFGTLHFDLNISDAVVQFRSGGSVTRYARCP